MALEWELPVRFFCQGTLRLSVHGYSLAGRGQGGSRKIVLFFSTAVLHSCGGKWGGSSPMVGRDMDSPPGMSMVARSHDPHVFLYLTNDLSLLKMGPFACEPGDVGHSRQGHVEPRGVRLTAEVFSCSLWTLRQEWMPEWDARCSSSKMKSYVCACLFSFSPRGTCFSLIAGMCIPSKPARSRAVLLMAVLSHELVDVINVTWVTCFHMWQILTKDSLLSTPSASSLASPTWVLDSKENFN